MTSIRISTSQQIGGTDADADADADRDLDVAFTELASCLSKQR
jgi:hypothetical protein